MQSTQLPSFGRFQCFLEERALIFLSNLVIKKQRVLRKEWLRTGGRTADRYAYLVGNTESGPEVILQPGQEMLCDLFWLVLMYEMSGVGHRDDCQIPHKLAQSIKVLSHKRLVL